jgi:ATP-dependent RNA helicase RhlE
MPFSTLGLSPTLTLPLAELGYSQPTPVQLEAIPVVLSGRDLLARAQTGTGKTAAFGLPMIDRLLVRGRRTAGARRPRGLVLVPTRELALQVHKALLTYGAPVSLRATAIFGGVPIRGQILALQRGTDIIVATPGRLLDHMQRRAAAHAPDPALFGNDLEGGRAAVVGLHQRPGTRRRLRGAGGGADGHPSRAPGDGRAQG